MMATDLDHTRSTINNPTPLPGRHRGAHLGRVLQIGLKMAAFALVAYGLLVAGLWRFQERIAFPAPRSRLPEPAARGFPGGRRIQVVAADGVTLRGWYLPADSGAGAPAPGLVWCYGNGETVAALAPVLAYLRPPGVAIVVLDYRGYGESDGKPTEAGLFLDAEAAWDFIRGRDEVDGARIAVYGHSLGSAPALHLAATRPVRAVVLSAPLTTARDVARIHYPYVPPLALRLELNNLERVRRLEAPLLVLHGTDDDVVPFRLGQEVAGAAPRGELVAIAGAGHNDAHAVDGTRYRDAMHRFLAEHLR